ncbi:hypothetical protein [Rubinisphaera brasiliensis]|uniref:Uncharacterized protein n=1 Tax=Rubinisphaera brasiliensis (strain ATCC 49424 / DSM 5305 / JCM 21570 / IAM 15109 / NBRC 103401 / IFAM 1448) TaxID=756272 RepID=F0SSU2_RUBBR|nr:hypothetical protein [Rubinisphaera brasiliensis]ADY61420.1 hypothetical protein Plabr_3836 [Rubinisphaera brasiliensis DSM 5305]
MLLLLGAFVGAGCRSLTLLAIDAGSDEGPGAFVGEVRGSPRALRRNISIQCELRY